MIEKFKKRWMKFAYWLGNINGKILLTVFYFTVFLIPNLIFTYFSKRLEKKVDEDIPSYFHDEKINVANLDEAKRQW
jgi:hypothetical protein